MGHNSTKLNSKTAICATNLLHLPETLNDKKYDVILISKDASEDFVNIVVSDNDVVNYDDKLYYFVLNEKDEYDKSFLAPFVNIVCRCKVDNKYCDYSLKDASKFFVLSINHRLACKYIAFAGLSLKSFYCVEDRPVKLTQVGFLSVICSFKPVSLTLYNESIKKGMTRDDAQKELKKLNPSFGAFVTLKALQYLNSIGVKIAVLEATDVANVGIYSNWGFKLGLGPLFSYDLSAGVDALSIESAKLSHKNNLTKFTYNPTFKNVDKLREDCVKLENPDTGYRMWIYTSSEGTRKLRDYVKSKFSKQDLLTKYADSLDYNIPPRFISDSQIPPSTYK